MSTTQTTAKKTATAAKKAAAKSPARKATPTKVATSRKVTVHQPVSQPLVRAAGKVPPTSKVAAKTPAQATASKTKAPKKPKLVRDSFTMPKDEYQAIDGLKQRATRLQRHAKKSELLRAGILALTAMDDKAFAATLAKVPTLKTGRPGRA